MFYLLCKWFNYGSIWQENFGSWRHFNSFMLQLLQSHIKLHLYQSLLLCLTFMSLLFSGISGNSHQQITSFGSLRKGDRWEYVWEQPCPLCACRQLNVFISVELHLKSNSSSERLLCCLIKMRLLGDSWAWVYFPFGSVPTAHSWFQHEKFPANSSNPQLCWLPDESGQAFPGLSLLPRSMC